MAGSVDIRIGGLQFSAGGGGLVDYTIESGDAELPRATIRLERTHPLVSLVPLNGDVLIVPGGIEHGEALFGGSVISSELDDDSLVLTCSMLPEMATNPLNGTLHAQAGQALRFLILESGADLRESDDVNPACPAATLSIDWDSFIDALTTAPDFPHLRSVVRAYIADDKLRPSESEQQVMSSLLHRLIREALKNAPPGSSEDSWSRSFYEDAFPDVWGLTWKYRRAPGEYIVITPVRELTSSGFSVLLHGVEFGTAGMDEEISEALPESDPQWSRLPHARVVVHARDLHEAKTIGVRRIREAMAVLAFAYGYSPAFQKVDDHDYRAIPYRRPTGARPSPGPDVLVFDRKSREYWLGPTNPATAPAQLEDIVSARHALLDQISLDSSNELLRHVRRALEWRYRAVLAPTAVDRFLSIWISMEMLLQEPHENTPALVRRLPFALASVGDRVKEIRKEVQTQWVPLRDQIVHQALDEHPDAEEGARRISFFSDCVVSYALARSTVSPSYTEWLAHLDSINRTRP